jgi:hypothetical protein
LFVAVIIGILPWVHTFRKGETQFPKWRFRSTYTQRTKQNNNVQINMEYTTHDHLGMLNVKNASNKMIYYIDQEMNLPITLPIVGWNKKVLDIAKRTRKQRTWALFLLSAMMSGLLFPSISCCCLSSWYFLFWCLYRGASSWWLLIFEIWLLICIN